MGRVLVGALIGAILGGLLGCLAKELDAGFQLNHPGPGGGWQLVSLAKVVTALAIVFGAGAGGIIGAIAGAVSAQPDTRPVPNWFWCLLLGLVALVVVGAALLVLLPGGKPVQPDRRNAPDLDLPAIDQVNPPEQNPNPQVQKE